MINEFTSAKLNRPRIKIIFEFSVPNPRLTFYRGVQATDGSFRMEKRGLGAKKFRPTMWCGSEESLHQFRKNIERLYGTPQLQPGRHFSFAI